MSYSSLVMPCLALRSTDTVETLTKTQQRYHSLAASDPDKANVIHTCANLQKKATGLSGLMCEVQDSSLLNATDMLTEEAFRGVSVVKCNIDDMQALSVLQRKPELGETLRGLMHDMQEARKNQAGMLLDQIMPTDAAQDFWWLGQTCEYKGGSTTEESILHDGKRGDVVFYDAFTCITRSENALNTHEAGSDCSFRDACVWEPNLHGSIGIYTQGAGDGNNLFVVCISDFDQIASDIVLSMKADLGSSISAADFCTSKEMWFLEHIALRNRLRLILRVAQHLCIKVPQKMDMYAHPQQQNADLAVECCGVNLDHIECQIHADARTHQAISVVRHYKDCVDVMHQKGPIPVFLGHEQGFLLLLPERASYASFAIYNDTAPYVQNKTGECVHLCPTHNINEQNRLNLQKIRTEQQSIVHITIGDLLYDCHLQGLHILQHTVGLRSRRDSTSKCIEILRCPISPVWCWSGCMGSIVSPASVRLLKLAPLQVTGRLCAPFFGVSGDLAKFGGGWTRQQLEWPDWPPRVGCAWESTRKSDALAAFLCVAGPLRAGAFNIDLHLDQT